MMLVSWQISLD